MAEREERPKAAEKGAGAEAAREKLPPAEGQEESLKVHGDKLEQKKR
jgi:hypothetical protein